MSERDTPEQDERVSPYLLRPARTYEEYLRDRETADQELERLEAAVSEARTDWSPARAFGPKPD